MSETSLERRDEGRFALRGTLDFTAVPLLWQFSETIFTDDGPIHIDLTEVERADSAALALFTEWLREARARGRTVHFDHLPDQLVAMARLSGVLGILQGGGEGAAGGGSPRGAN